jgi:hypothetical protein
VRKIMSEAENLDLDLELETETNPALDLINALQRGDFNAADQLFQDTLGAKVQDTLDAEKVAVAGQIFNGEEPYEDIDDEESVEDVEYGSEAEEFGEDDSEVTSELEEIEDINLDEIDDFIEVE